MLSFVFTILISIQPQQLFNIDHEWLDSGWELKDRITYPITDYVDPYSVNSAGVPEYFVEMCFSDTGEFRCAIAGKEEVVFLSEYGEMHSATLPDFRNIFLFPDHIAAIACDTENRNYLIHGISGSSECFLESDEFFFRWYISDDGNIAGIGRNSLVFYDSDGMFVSSDEHEITYLPTFVQWTNAASANRIFVLNMIDTLIESYDSAGNIIQRIDHPWASGGIVAFDVSDNGQTIAVSLGSKGIRVFTDGDTNGRILLEDHLTASIGVSPSGEFISFSATSFDSDQEPIQTGLNLYDISSSDITTIPFDEQNWYPCVLQVMDDGSILGGFYESGGGYGYNSYNAVRFVLFDSNGTPIWISAVYPLDQIVAKLPGRARRYDTGGRLVAATYKDETMCRICYWEPTDGGISVITISSEQE